VVCCDLYVSKQTSGTLFFQKDKKEAPWDSESVTASVTTAVASNVTQTQTTAATKDINDNCDIACIGFDRFGKIRLIDFTEEEESLFSSEVVLEKWKFGTINHNIEKIIGVPEFKLLNSPWWTMEGSNERHLEARRLVIGIMEFMWNLGW
jgi:hypothetical protein